MSTATTTDQPPMTAPIRVTRDGHRLYMSQDAVDLLDVSTTRIEMRDDGALVRQSQSLLQRTYASTTAPPTTSFSPSTGLLPVLELKAASLGIALDVQSALPLSAAALQPGHGQSLRNFVNSNPIGVIRSPPRSKSAIIANLVDANPDNRIVVLAAHIDSLHALRRQLIQFGISPFLLDRSSTPDLLAIQDTTHRDPQITLTRFATARHLDLGHADIVLMLDATECCHERAVHPLSQVDARFRLYGILSRVPTAYEQDHIFAKFGFAVHAMAGVGWVRRDVAIRWQPISNPQYRARQSGGSEFLRHAYWGNPQRNDRIARTASNLRRDNPTKSVTILTATNEHACSLARQRHLAEWPIVADADAVNTRRDSEILAQRHRSAFSDCRQQIVVAGAAETFDGSVSGFIVWAGGGPYAAPIPLSWLDVPTDANRPLVVIDFVDHYSRPTKRWSRTRAAAYTAQDWYDEGVTSEVGRLREFCAQKGIIP